MLMEKRLKIYKALSDETRLRIVDMLEGKRLCVCKILKTLNITQPTLSHHMKVLQECDIIDSERVGRKIHYFLNKETVNSLTFYMSNIDCNTDSISCDEKC